ncbi:hypothetical protein JZM24_15850 [Candidatus Sodalis endolongispinus]|uniref:Uncharacterized protein n=1 Tax=Candidatus Sodalis endolongispinus TaxID=2812662 RepID=A0ABS5YE44_9GAMM|nr:hypothetical protein [Candidatus Sodalis endolongispinus]MBT9433221.1 hypothetical protein [Candidatus Sodalis endolongispinus]
MPASLQHHRKTTGLFQHQQRRTEPPLQEVLLHLAQQPGDADKYRRTINYLGLISIITHIGAVAAQPERPSAFTGGRASARQRAADEGVHGNATADTAGPGAWAKRRLTGMRSSTSHGLSAPLTAKEALRYETTPSILSTTMPVLEQIAPQTQQNAARDKRQPSAHHRRHAAHRARKHKTKPAATLARKPVLASAEVSAADIIRSSAAKPPSTSAVQMPANSLMATAMTPAANLMSVSGAHQQNLRDRRHTAYRPGRAWDQPVHPHSDLPPCEDLDGPPSRLPDASKSLFFLTDTNFDLPPCPSLTGPHGRQPDTQAPPFATSGKTAHYLPLHIESVVTTSTALSSCLFSQNKHVCAVTKAGSFFFSGYLAHWLYQSVTAPSHGVPASPPPALDPPPGADLQSDRQNAPAMDPVPSAVTAPVSEAALLTVKTPVSESALSTVKTPGSEAALAAVKTPGPEAAFAAVKIPAPQAASMVVETPATKTAPASVALSQASTGAGSLSLTASGLPIPLLDGQAPALVSVIALATATPEPRDPAGSFTAIDMAHSSHLTRPAAPTWSEMLQHITLHYAHI